MTTSRRARTAPRYVLGLIPQTSGTFEPAMDHAVQERIQAIQARADCILRQALADHEPWRVIHGARSGICSPRMSGIVEYAASTNT